MFNQHIARLDPFWSKNIFSLFSQQNHSNNLMQSLIEQAFQHKS